jgi:hypothetical protein
MKILFISFPITILMGCNSPKRVIKHNDIIFEKSYHIPDSTLEPGYDPKQRAFYWYLMSLSQEERNNWVSQGSFSENEKNEFLRKIDSLQMDIQLPDPPNSTIPDSSKNK